MGVLSSVSQKQEVSQELGEHEACNDTFNAKEATGQKDFTALAAQVIKLDLD